MMFALLFVKPPSAVVGVCEFLPSPMGLYSPFIISHVTCGILAGFLFLERITQHPHIVSQYILQ